MIGDLETIRFERIGDVLRVVIDRPDSDLNAIDARLHDDLCSTVRMLKDLDDIRAVVLTGHGRAFSAGGDFGWFPALEEPGAREHLRRKGKQLIWDLLDVEVPIVAAINGPAMGLGATLALLCDVIFISEEATIGDPHVRVGIVAGDGGTVIWPLAVGPALAKRYLLTGDSMGAEEAHRLGLVTQVVPSGALEAEALAFAQRLARGAPLAIRYTKLAVNTWIKTALASAFDVATAYEVLTMHSDDHREALDALAEKREPQFRGI